MAYSRREFGKLALNGMPVAAVALANPTKLFAEAKPDSKFGGVQIGVITGYSYHDVPNPDPVKLLPLLVRDGVSGTEMETIHEIYAGAPVPQRPAAAGPYVRVDTPADFVRPPVSKEAQAAADAHAEELTKWRLSASMDKYVALRKIYADAGVWIYGFKLQPTMRMPDGEFDYMFNAAKAIGANQLTMELPTDRALTKRIGDFASKHKLLVAYHSHLQSTPHVWDEALAQSPYNGINIDIGHYVAAGNTDTVEFVRTHHDRIGSIHIKDRKSKANGIKNMPFGQGDTPIKEVLLLMKKEKYKFPATIELEYSTPTGSTCEEEIKKCVQYCKAVLTA